MLEPGPRALHAPATARNRDPILEVLLRVLPPAGLALEVASGTGEHAAWFAPRLPGLSWQPSDPDAVARASIEAWRQAAAAGNLLPPLDLDVRRWPWPLERAEAVVAINMIHISPWQATEGLLRGSAALLGPGAPLVLYGPFRREGRHTASSNEAFDTDLRMRDPSWGVRDLEAVAEVAEAFDLDEVVAMPANNLTVVFRRRPL